MSAALLAAAAGLGLGLSLIVAIGAQNAFVLRQGLRLEHVAAVVGICLVSDAVLILAGVAGAGAVVTRVPEVIQVVCFAGAGFLLVYGLMAARRVFRPGALLPESGGSRTRLAVTVASRARSCARSRSTGPLDALQVHQERQLESRTPVS